MKQMKYYLPILISVLSVLFFVNSFKQHFGNGTVFSRGNSNVTKT